jgi:hypothetical protein
MMSMRAKAFQGCKEAVERPGQAKQRSRNQSQKNPKSEIRNKFKFREKGK